MEATIERPRRVQMIVQMLAGYGIEDPTEDRLRGYLSVLEGVPTERLAAAISRAMKTCPRCPVPGEVYGAWRELRESGGQAGPRIAGHERPQEHGARLGAPTRAALASGPVTDGLEGYIQDPSGRKLMARAREIRRTHRVPQNPLKSRTLSYVAAAIELGHAWPLEVDHRKLLSQWVREHEDHDPEAETEWWWREVAQPTVTALRWRRSA